MTSANKAPEPIRVVAVGMGWVALNRHLPCMDRSSSYEVIGVIDRHIDRARRVAESRGYRYFGAGLDPRDSPWLCDADAVTVSTSPTSHFAVAASALDLGKHVLTEKPFAMTVGDGEDMLQRSANADLRLGVVHNFQFARSVARLRHELRTGIIGDIVGIDAFILGNPSRRLPEWYEDLPLGLFFDEGPHPLYLCEALAGKLAVDNVYCVARAGRRTPVRLEAWLKTAASNLPVRLSCNFESPVSEWHILVHGTNRLGIVDIFRDIYLSIPNDKSHSARYILRTSVAATLQHWAQYVSSGLPYLMGRLSYGNDEVFARFAAAVRGNLESFSPISGHAALSTLRLQHDIIHRATCS